MGAEGRAEGRADELQAGEEEALQEESRGQRVEVTDQREDHMGKDEKARLGPGRASQTGKETENKQVRKE